MTEKTSGSGGLVQLAAYGAEDIILSGDPQITFFKNLYKRHSNFSMESVQLIFTDSPQFGGTSFINIKRHADLVTRLYLEVTLPYDENLTESYWTNRIGFRLINRVELYIGKKLVDRLYGIYMHIWTELTHSDEKKLLLDKIVGTTHNNGFSNGLSCNIQHKLIIPLPFAFSRYSGLALPLNAIRNNRDISLKFYFEKKENCIQTGELPSNNLSNVTVWADYIYLETEENRLFVQKPLEYLIEVTQHLERNLVTSGTKSIRLPFTLPCKELCWSVYDLNRSGDKFTDFTYGNNSMVQKVQFKLNSMNLFSSGARDNNYFNYVQPYQHHYMYPDLGINCYSFAIYPDQLYPSGILNFKNIANSVMNITTYGNGYIHIFAVSYNIMKISKGDVDMVYKF